MGTRAYQTIEKHSLAANEQTPPNPQGRPWAADRYLPSDLADGDFQEHSLPLVHYGLLGRQGGPKFVLWLFFFENNARIPVK